jgi:hypothetical protein
MAENSLTELIDLCAETAASPEFLELVAEVAGYVPVEWRTGHAMMVECGHWQLGGGEVGANVKARVGLWVRPCPYSKTGYEVYTILPFAAAGSLFVRGGTRLEKMTTKRNTSWFTKSCWVLHPVTEKPVCRL